MNVFKTFLASAVIFAGTMTTVAHSIQSTDIGPPAQPRPGDIQYIVNENVKYFNILTKEIDPDWKLAEHWFYSVASKMNEEQLWRCVEITSVVKAITKEPDSTVFGTYRTLCLTLATKK